MAPEGRESIVLDTSVLINFLAIGRLDLLTGDPSRDYLLTDHVVTEITEEEQRKKLNQAIANGRLTVVSIAIDSPAGELFASLCQQRRLGTGECAAIAYASAKNLVVAIDDKTARKCGRANSPELQITGTTDLMAKAICEGRIDVATADAIKQDWEQRHRFRLPFESFKDLT